MSHVGAVFQSVSVGKNESVDGFTDDQGKIYVAQSSVTSFLKVTTTTVSSLFSTVRIEVKADQFPFLPKKHKFYIGLRGMVHLCCELENAKYSKHALKVSLMLLGFQEYCARYFYAVEKDSVKMVETNVGRKVPVEIAFVDELCDPSVPDDVLLETPPEMLCVSSSSFSMNEPGNSSFFDDNSENASPYFGRKSALNSSMTLRKNTSSVQYSDSEMDMGLHDEELDSFNDLHADVLRSTGVELDECDILDATEIEVMMSDRPISEVKTILQRKGHSCQYIGDKHGFRETRYCWRIELNVLQYSIPVQRALSHFHKVQIVRMEKKSTWKFSSIHLCKQDLQELVQMLLYEAVPLPPIPEEFNSFSCAVKLMDENSFLRPQSGTAMSDADSNIMGKRMALVSYELLRCITKAKACYCGNQKMNVYVNETPGLCPSIGWRCQKCNQETKLVDIENFSEKQALVMFSCGRPAALKRALCNFGLSLKRLYCTDLVKSRLYDATKAVYQQYVDLTLLCSVVSAKGCFSFDVFHKRMAKHASSLGESFSLAISICCCVRKKVVCVFAFERRKLQASFAKTGKVSIVSPVTGHEITTHHKGGEHAVVHLSLKILKEMIQRAKNQATTGDGVLLAERADVNLELFKEKVMEWDIAELVSDSLSSAAGSIQSVFPNCQHFFDWWHRRHSFKKAMKKLEDKKGKGKEDKKFPGFIGMTDVLSPIASDCIFMDMSFDAFMDEAVKRLDEAGIHYNMDKEHSDAFDSLMTKGEKHFDSIRMDRSSSLNERFHAHVRFFAVKGDAMSHAQWEMCIYFAVLSFNNFAKWKEEILKYMRK